MAKIIVFANDKGGVAKTSLSREMAYGLAVSHRVLLIDLAPEMALSAFMVSEEAPITIAEVLQKGIEIEKAIVQITDKLAFVSGSADLEIVKAQMTAKPQMMFGIRKAFLSIANQFDYIIIDTQGNTDNLIKGAIAAANLVIVPMALESTSLVVTAKFLAGLESLADLINPLPKIGIVITHYDATATDQSEDLGNVKEWGHRLLGIIGRTRKIGEAMKAGKTLRQVDHDNPRIKELDQLFSEAIKWVK